MNLVLIYIVPIYLYKYSIPILKYIVVDNIIPTMITLSGKGIKSIYTRLTYKEEKINENWICI